ncbi:MAG: tetratricopeptide repeat protein, partial [Rhodospirillales bacterium]|nr:tetratricopeptide repeat protein [Rhodospirillales bacterium]
MSPPRSATGRTQRTAHVAHRPPPRPLVGGAVSESVLDQPFLQLEPGAADPRLVEALQRLNAGDLDGCIALTRESLAARPDQAPGQELLGAALALKGDLDGALAALERAVAIDPRQSSAWTKLGDILMAQGNAATAADALQRAIAVDPMDRRAHQRLGVLMERRGDVPGAILHYEQGGAAGGVRHGQSSGFGRWRCAVATMRGRKHSGP